MVLKNKHKIAYMKCCQAFAECSDDERLQVGSVIVKNNRIISCGYNAHTEHITAPNQLPNGQTDPRVRHSEKNALMGLIKSILPVYNETTDKTLKHEIETFINKLLAKAGRRYVISSIWSCVLRFG